MEQFYYELTLKIPNNLKSIFCDFLLSVTKEAIEEKNDLIIVRSQNELDNIEWGLIEFKNGIEKHLNSTIDINIKKEKKKNQDWIKNYQDSIQPIEIPPFFIRPSWHNEKDNLIDILINPALAFGSGHHPTTSSCLKLIPQYIKKDMNILDVGCGSGILSIASAKLGANIDICDTDELSIEQSIKNSKLNNIQINNSWVGSANNTDKNYDLVLANIVADVLIFIAKDLQNRVKKNGYIILSGILNNYEEKVLQKFKEFEVIDRLEIETWVTLILIKK
jgi:ribosomal protein L11 methyltransferase